MVGVVEGGNGRIGGRSRACWRGYRWLNGVGVVEENRESWGVGVFEGVMGGWNKMGERKGVAVLKWESGG